MSSINLVKGQKIDLTKDTGVTKVVVGLGWDTAETGQDFDLDASVVELDSNGKYSDMCYFNKLDLPGIHHTGDNLTGEGDGDDEQIEIEFSKIDGSVDKLKFVVNIYQAQQRNQNFGQVSNAFIRVVDKATGNEMMKYDLSEDYSTTQGLIIGEMYKKDGNWKFAAVEQGFSGDLDSVVNFFK